MINDIRFNSPVADSSAAVTYPPYPEYKESSVEWLRDIPSHWEVKKLKFVSIVQPSNVDKKTIEGEEEILLCNYTDVYKNEYINNRLEFMRATATSSEINKFAVDKGDVIVTKDSEDPRDIAVPACAAEKVEGLLCGYHLTQIKPLSVYGRYVFRLFQSRGFNAQFVVAANGVTRFGLPQYAISNAFVLLPSTEEQQTIAAFLDYKTAKIDALIAKKKTLLEKLAEKRTALISHAVTKGLDPKAPMRDSGIDWLGQIPAHWEVKRLKYLGRLQNGINIGGEHFGSGYPFVSYGDVYNNRILPTTVNGLLQSSPIERQRYSVNARDVFFTRTSETIEEIGFPSICLQTIEDGVFAGFLIRFRPNSTEMADAFGVYYYQNNFLRAFFVKEMNLVTRASLSQELLGIMPVLLPPKDEQQQIASYLDEETSRLNVLEDRTKEFISRLQEYRAALISNAVTGKIDVRNVRFAEAEEIVNHE